MACRLIVNADDLGLCDEVNVGVIEAYERGIVTSASLMVGRPAARSGAERALRAKLDLGLHIELGEWHYGRRGWQSFDEVPADGIVEEIESQLDVFRRLVADDPSHLDSHQHVHLREPARAAVSELAGQLRVPLRNLDPRIRYCGDFYGQSDRGDTFPDCVSVAALVHIIASLDDGLIELSCHPARGPVQGSPYDHERGIELTTLCDPRVRAAIDKRGIAFTTFREIAA